MNITGQMPYQKGQTHKSNPPTKQQRERWERVRKQGCAVCRAFAEIHHLFTGAGGRKDHDKVAPLCHFHHRGAEGIHTLGRKVWQVKYKTEQEMFEMMSAIV